MINKRFWKNKKVFITGHTGFKGSWLCVWLNALGAKVTGYALKPPTKPSLFYSAGIDRRIESIIGDIRDLRSLKKAMMKANPEMVIHLAAQPLVRDSYKIPVETYETNVMGTVNLLDTVRLYGDRVRVVVNVTTDKVYENREWNWGYRENEPFGGYDPYSNSKACSELVTSAYRNSYFNPADYKKHGVGIATARAGNVIGGGDWATDRIIPDCIKAILSDTIIIVRNPAAIRPWQHVLEPLSGYLCLAEKLWKDGPKYSQGWNFGPVDDDCRNVQFIVNKICDTWGPRAKYTCAKTSGPHEAAFLKLDSSKARALLGWRQHWYIEKALSSTVEWYRARASGKKAVDICLKQIDEFERKY